MNKYQVIEKYKKICNDQTESHLNIYQMDLKDPNSKSDKEALRLLIKRENQRKAHLKGLISALNPKVQKTVNQNNQVALLKALTINQDKGFLFLEFANLINEKSNSPKKLDIKEFIEIGRKLLFGLNVPISSFARYADDGVYWYLKEQVFQQTAHPKTVKRYFYHSVMRNTKHIYIDSKDNKIEIDSEQSIKYLSRVISDFRSFLKDMTTKSEEAAINLFSIESKHAEYTEAGMSSNKSFSHYEYSSPDNYENSTLAHAKIDLLRYLYTFDIKFALERIGQCNYCTNYFFKDRSDQRSCSTKCSRKYQAKFK